MNRFTIHLDVLAPDPETAWELADRIADAAGSGSYALTVAHDWSVHVKPPPCQHRPCDHPDQGCDCCKDCGVALTWTGPGSNDWQEVES